MHTTNYTNTFIEVAEDCSATAGTPPPEKAVKTIARMQYEMLISAPYRYTSDDVMFAVYATRQGIKKADLAAHREMFFAKGQPCFRSSALGKTYGFGVHFDAQSRMAIVGSESKEYSKFKADTTLKHVKAMRSAR